MSDRESITDHPAFDHYYGEPTPILNAICKENERRHQNLLRGVLRDLQHQAERSLFPMGWRANVTNCRCIKTGASEKNELAFRDGGPMEIIGFFPLSCELHP